MQHSFGGVLTLRTSLVEVCQFSLTLLWYSRRCPRPSQFPPTFTFFFCLHHYCSHSIATIVPRLQWQANLLLIIPNSWLGGPAVFVLFFFFFSYAICRHPTQPKALDYRVSTRVLFFFSNPPTSHRLRSSTTSSSSAVWRLDLKLTHSDSRFSRFNHFEIRATPPCTCRPAPFIPTSPSVLRGGVPRTSPSTTLVCSSLFRGVPGCVEHNLSRRPTHWASCNCALPLQIDSAEPEVPIQ